MDRSECMHTLTDHSSKVRCLEWVGDHQFASGSADETIRVWDVDAGGCVRIIKGIESDVMTQD